MEKFKRTLIDIALILVAVSIGVGAGMVYKHFVPIEIIYHTDGGNR